ncbi:hypothetical protein CISG_04932 [Coccidioides immitis RMSCC 3703]|uniref:Uncharacterized protein n=2 Tax=Coccidioides immitis TaxID=5501 RepID=A0A0J8QS33_COCIT|nr:hypothetical protein CIRG_00957 [Coccidioides immitis RMSCC 2394]KMU75529.1 hypothetical protein CISG_04932 [Coccidioides immitis RMSCC 3703]
MSNGRDEGCGEATRKGERLGPKFRVSVGYDTGYLYSVLVHVYACVCERQTNGEKLPSRREKEDSQFDYSVCTFELLNPLPATPSLSSRMLPINTYMWDVPDCLSSVLYG